MLQEYCILEKCRSVWQLWIEGNSIKSRYISYATVRKQEVNSAQHVGKDNKVLGAARPSVEAN